MCLCGSLRRGLRRGLRLSAMSFIAACLAACAGTGTASGKPDVVLHAVDRGCFRNTFLAGAVDDGWRVVQAGDVQLSFARAARSGVVAALFGTGQGLPEERMTMTMIPVAGTGDTRVVVDGAFVGNPGTAFEQRSERRFSADDQRAFFAMARRAETTCGTR